MFDNIRFRNTKLDIPITHSNYTYTFAHYFDDSDMLLAANSELLQGEFAIDGSSQQCIQYLTSPYAEEHLFHIHSFSILDNHKDYFTRRKKMDSYLLSITYEGSGYLEYEGRSYEILPGHCFLIDCKKPHYYKTNKDRWKHADLHFKGAFTEKIVEEFNENREYVLPWTEDGDLQRQLEKLISTYDDVIPYRDLLISNQLETLLLSLLKVSDTWHRVHKGIPENLQDLVRYMEIHYMDHLTLDFLADFSGINKYYLIRLFKKHMGISPKEYIIMQQINTAKNMLKETSLPANKIGAIVVLENENHFRHLFKERTGMSPGEFRKSE